jgi:hypothetical protein
MLHEFGFLKIENKPLPLWDSSPFSGTIAKELRLNVWTYLLLEAEGVPTIHALG